MSHKANDEYYDSRFDLDHNRKCAHCHNFICDNAIAVYRDHKWFCDEDCDKDHVPTHLKRQAL